MGNLKDFATALITVAPSPATSGTSLEISSSDASRMPSVPFKATVYPNGEIPTLDNAEKVLVTVNSSGALTITRAQGDTTAKSIEAGWRLTNALFKADLDEKADKAKLDYVEVSVTTAAATAAKVGTTTGGSYTPSTGDILLVTFSLANTASNPTLNVDGSGAKSILIGNVAPSNIAMAGTKVLMWYDGTAYQLFGSQRASDTDTNTTYTGITGSTATTTAATKTLVINSLDLANYASGQLSYTLPATAAVGSVIEVYGMSSGGWKITAPAGDNIIMEDGVNSGAAGHIFAGQYAWVQLRCTVANATWVVTSSSGIIENNNGSKTGTLDSIADGATNKHFTSTEKSKLSGIADGAQVNAVASVAGKTGAVTLDKADVGLGSVDNTSNATERAATATLTNKRIDPRVSSTASASSLTPDIASFDQYVYTALAANLTINAPTGTPVVGNKLLFAIKDNGTSRTLTWNAAFAPVGVTLPTATTVGKWTYVGCIYNASATRWDVIAVTTEA